MCGCAEVEKSRSLEVQGPVGRYRPAIVFLVECINRAALVRLIILIA